MELAHRWGDRNLTRMELVIALLILALLIGFFSHYMLTLFARAERSMMNRTVININTALNYRASMAVMRGKYDVLESLLNMNPMEEMQVSPEINDFDNRVNTISLVMAGSTVSTPVNYGGVIASENFEIMEKGKWYFDQGDHLLIYTINNAEYFSTDVEGLARIRFRIKIEYSDNNANNQYDLEIDEFNSVKLQSLDQYNWNI